MYEKIDPVEIPEIHTTDAILPPELQMLDLPRGYGVKGGAARAIVTYTLFGQELPVRDIDLISLPYADESLAGELAMKYMPRDFKYGHGPELSASVEDLIVGRDFTMNEVVVVDGKIFYTDKAKEALKDKHIELSSEIPGIKMKAKAQLFAAALEAAGFTPSVAEELNQIYWDPFWCGLMLDRALEQGDKVADLYTKRLTRAMSEARTSTVELARWVADDPYLSNVSFEHVTALLMKENPDYLIGDRYSGHYSQLGQNALKGWRHAQD